MNPQSGEYDIMRLRVSSLDRRVNKVAQFEATVAISHVSRDPIGMCGGQMASRGEQKLTIEMMKCAQQR